MINNEYTRSFAYLAFLKMADIDENQHVESAFNHEGETEHGWVNISSLDLTAHLRGVAANIFKTMSIRCQFGTFSNKTGNYLTIEYNYSWTHHSGGSNGDRIRHDFKMDEQGHWQLIER